eukprot:m.37066 g.37066  ORF g.37066 m.37066 type:complete len:353 (-) comp9760_c0_seq2:49-1107(-)
MAVRSLQDLCASVVAKHISLFSNLEGLPVHLADAIFEKLYKTDTLDLALIRLLSSQRCCLTSLPLSARCVNAWIPYIAQLQWLESITFTKSNITNKAIKDLLVLSETLRKLVLDGCERVDDEGVAMLVQFQQLFELTLSHLPLVTGKKLKGTYPRLEQLEVSHCPKLLDVPLSCPRLIDLTLNFTAMPAPAITCLIKRCPRVKTLHARGSQLTDWPRELSACLPHLTVLDLAYSRLRTGVGLAFHPHLTHLDLSHTTIGDASIHFSSLTRLVELRLAATAITAAAITRLPPNLQLLDISSSNVDEGAVATLATMDTLKHLDISLTEISLNASAFLGLRLPHCTILAEEMCVL